MHPKHLLQYSKLNKIVLQTEIFLLETLEGSSRSSPTAFLRVLRWSNSMNTAMRLGWLFQPERICFVQILTKNDLEHQETQFKRLLHSYLASTLDNMRNAENSAGKN